jgi:DNA-binding transcriptional ArsR family regulator
MSLPETQDGGDGSSSVDYSAVDLPDTADKPRTEWHYTTRRAEILQLLREAGHPGELNQTELGERYGVSQQQISKDLKRLGESIRQSLDEDRRALAVDAVVQRSIRGLLDEGEWFKAAQLAMDWDRWVDDSSIQTGSRAKGTDDFLAQL